MKETWTESVVKSLETLGGAAKLSKIYSAVKKRREQLGFKIPRHYTAVIRKELEYNSSDSSNWRGGRDLFYSVEGIGAGVWGLADTLPSTPKTIALKEQDIFQITGKIEQTVYRIIRDTKMVKKLKVLHNNCCQICGEKIFLAEEKYYSEGHHIKPLGSPHEGPDIPSNIIIVCPNHHVLLDYGAIKLDAETLHIAEGHKISEEFIEYHNTRILKMS